jgi:hypothetical protein
LTERQFQKPEQTLQALSAEQDELLKWLQNIYDAAELLKLITFESVYILKTYFGQLLHL